MKKTERQITITKAVGEVIASDYKLKNHIEPVVVNAHGEELVATVGPAFGEDDVYLDTGRVLHHHCGGDMEPHRVSASHQALTCDTCALRFVLPRGVQTFGDLRYYFSGDSYSFSAKTGEFRRHPREGRPLGVAAEGCLFCEARGGRVTWSEGGMLHMCSCVPTRKGV